MKKSIENRVQELRNLSRRIDDLFDLNQKAESEELLKRAIEESEDVPAYKLFFMGEAAGYLEKDNKKQEAFFKQALKKRGKDFFLLRNMGVCFSNQDREKEAIKWFDKALKNNPKDSDTMRQRGASLFDLGRHIEAIEWFDKALKENSKDCSAMRQRGATLAVLNRHIEAIEWYDKALKENPKYYMAMNNRGISLAHLGRHLDAIEWFDKALNENPKHFGTMRDKAVSLGYLGRAEEAIEWYDKAINENPKYYDAIRNKGVCLSNIGRRQEAVELFKKVLKATANDYKSYRAWAMTECNRGKFAKAFEKIRAAFKLAPDSEKITIIKELEFIAQFAGMQAQARELLKEYGKGRQAARLDNVGTVLGAFASRVQEIFKPRIKEFAQKMAEMEKTRKEFLNPNSNMRNDLSFLLVLRKWNSYTPAIPSGNEERSVGGGYYIRHEGQGIVIDPGYNFIENFAFAGGKITDIDNIVITHAHNDHTNDFESLMSLLYQFNRENNKASKKINVFLNTGSFKKFSGLLDLRGCNYFEGVYPLTHGAEHILNGGVKLRALPAYHDEVISKQYAVGILLSFNMPSGEKNILFTSDTGLFPKKKKDDKEIADTEGLEIHRLYSPYIKGKIINLLVPHIGSIKEKEINTSIQTELEEAFYPNHLGALGTVRLITEVKPKLAVVSEFGEELREFREDLSKLLRGAVENFFEDMPECPIVLPGDLPFIYDIQREEIYCLLCEAMVDFHKIDAKLVKLNGRQSYSDCFYYYSKEKKGKLDKLPGRCGSFLEKLAGKEAPYLKE